MSTFFVSKYFFPFILLIHEGSHPGRSTRNSNPVMTSFAGPVPLVPCNPSLHCPIASSASTHSQQPANRTANQI